MAKKGSKLGRLARLGRLGGRVGSSYLGDKVRSVFRDEDTRRKAAERLHLDNAERVVETLSRLKGAAMKVGQSLAMAASQLDLPDEVRASLSRLHAEAEPVPFDTIRATLVSELGGDLAEHFARVDPEPLGTASLAQAHAAALPDGTEVVVKVLHEGVAEAVETDLMALKGLMLSGRAMGRHKDEVEALYLEVKTRLREELDYLQEAVNIQAFREAWDPDDPRVRIPSHHPALCTDKVLTMDRLPGVPLPRFLETADEATRQRTGEHLADLFLKMAFQDRLLHADPHPGNYLFEPDGRVGLLDFGAVKRFSPFWIGHYAKAVLAAFDRDKATVLQAVRDLGAWVGDDPRAGDAIWQFCDMLVGPWRDGPYTIGGPHDSLIQRMRPAAEELWRYPEIHGPPDMMFLHRTLGGIYGMARELRVTDDWEARLRPYLEHAVAVMEGRAAG